MKIIFFMEFSYIFMNFSYPMKMCFIAWIFTGTSLTTHENLIIHRDFQSVFMAISLCAK